MIFAYRQYPTFTSPTVPTGVLYRPEISVRVVGTLSALWTWALVDPGSDDTLLPLSLAQAIGARMDPLQTWSVEGFGGQALPVVLGEIELELNDGNQTFRWPARIGVVDFADPQDEITLVGHAGFLDYFRVTFDGHAHALHIDVTPSFPGRVT